MAETADYDPGDWKGHDFKAARAAYTADAGRGYAEAVASHTTVSDLVPASIETVCERSLTVVCDVTGSFGTWPGVIFGKLPYLDIEGRSYLGDETEISFAAVGDAPMKDKFYLQVRPFASGTALTDHLKALKIEGGGGADNAESYELAALYYLKNASFPNATAKPILVFICDEGCHTSVSETHASAVHVDIHNVTSYQTTDIFRELTEKFAVYAIRKHYGSGEARVQEQWEGLIGADHIVSLDDPNAVVDSLFGILAKETDKIDYFRSEIEGRQEAGRVATVYKSLKTVHAGDVGVDLKGKSRMFLPGDAKKSRHLLPPTDLTSYWADVDPKPPATGKPTPAKKK